METKIYTPRYTWLTNLATSTKRTDSIIFEETKNTIENIQRINHIPSGQISNNNYTSTLYPNESKF